MKDENKKKKVPDTYDIDKNDYRLLKQIKIEAEKNSKVSDMKTRRKWKKAAKYGKAGFIAEFKLFNNNEESVLVRVKDELKFFKYRDHYYAIIPEMMVYDTTHKLMKLRYAEGYSIPISYEFDEDDLHDKMSAVKLKGGVYASNYRELVKGTVFQGLFTASKLVSDKIKTLFLIGVCSIISPLISAFFLYFMLHRMLVGG